MYQPYDFYHGIVKMYRVPTILMMQCRAVIIWQPYRISTIVIVPKPSPFPPQYSQNTPQISGFGLRFSYQKLLQRMLVLRHN